MRCIVLANCTHAPMREYLAASGVFDEVDSYALFALDEPQRKDLAKKVRGYDCVVSIAHADGWGALSKTALKDDMGDRCVIYTAPFFNGLHPDLIHIAHHNRRHPSVVSDYHSGLILWGYLYGVATERLDEMYRDGELPTIFEIDKVWEHALQELRRRDKSGDIDTADIYDQLCRDAPEMLTFNHPTMAIMGEIAHRALSTLGFQLPKLATTTIHNNLLTDVVFPVSPAAKKAFDLAFDVPQMFRAGARAKTARQYISFQRFAEESYTQYQSWDWSNVKVTTPNTMTMIFAPLIAAKASGEVA